MRWKHVDLALEERRPLGKVLARALANEIRSAAPDGSVAYRGAYRWTPSVRELAATPTGPAVPHRRDGTYLVTGGLGGLGLVFAEYLAERFERPTIVLTGRSPFPERETWGAYTAGCAQPDATAEQIARIRRIEGRCAAIRYVMADITNEQDMQRLQRSIASSGKLHGIVHAAGLPGDGLVAGKSRESALRILAPKVEGTLLLARSFPPEQLDFMLLCSSLNAWAPVAGQVDYCAANAFMDAWAHQQQLERGANVLSIDWCAWRDAGMARAAHAQAAGSPSQGDPMANAISNDEAARVLDMVLAAPLPQVVVSPMALLDARRRLTVGGAAPQEPAGAEAPRQRGASADAAPPVNATQKRLLAIWERQFGMAGIGVHDDFFALGGHSLLATQVLAELRDAFDVDLPLRAIFEAPTVALLAARVEEQEAGRDGPQRAKRSAFIATTKQQLDGMSAEQLAALLEEKRRLKAQRQQPAATSSEEVARRPL